MRTLPCRILLLGVSGIILLPAALRASSPPEGSGRGSAEELLERVVTAYRGLTIYSDDGQYRLAMTVNGVSKKEIPSIRLRLRFQRGGGVDHKDRIDIDSSVFRLVSDGKDLAFAYKPTRRFIRRPAPGSLREALTNTSRGVFAAVIPDGPSGYPMLTLFHLLVGTDPAAAIREDTVGLVYENETGPEAGAGKPHRLLVDQREGPDIRLIIDPATYLLQKIELVGGLESVFGAQSPGMAIREATFVWEAGRVDTKVLPDVAFRFDDTGLKQVDRIEYLASRQLGEAPDFRLRATDGPEKVRFLTPADLAGKVAVVCFWNSSQPESLAQVRGLLEWAASRGGDRRLMTVLVNDEPGPADERGRRQSIERAFSENHLGWPQEPGIMVGLDLEHSVCHAFLIESVPTTVILDARGIIRAFHPQTIAGGFEKLGEEVDTLLKAGPP